MQIKKIHLKRLDLLTDSERISFRNSSVWQLSERGYLQSESEDQFMREYHQGSDPKAQPFASVGFLNDSPVLFFRGQIQNGELSFWGRPIRVHQEPEIAIEAKRNLFNAFSRELEANGIVKATFFHHDHLSAALWGSRSATHCEERGWIDLRLTDSDIMSSFRKSYRSLINWGRRSMTVSTFDHSNLTDDVVVQFRQFHIRIAGRETRSAESWNRQADIVRARRGYIVMGWLDGELVSSILNLHGKETAFYGVAVNDRSHMERGHAIGHWPLVHSILHAKTLGLTGFDLGPLATTDPKFQPTEKEAAIALFKKGFCEQIRSEIYNEFSFRRPNAIS